MHLPCALWADIRLARFGSLRLGGDPRDVGTIARAGEDVSPEPGGARFGGSPADAQKFIIIRKFRVAS